jgi:hypothetical protein
MLDALAITEAEAAGLSELATLDLAMARDFAKRAQAAEDPDTANDLARSYQRMARSYRQTLALKARLQRDIAAAQRAAHEAQGAGDDRPTRIAQRKSLLREKVGRLYRNEFEDEQEGGDELREALEAHLEALARNPAFLQLTVDELADHLIRRLEPVLDAIFFARLGAADAEADGDAADPDPPPIQSSA